MDEAPRPQRLYGTQRRTIVIFLKWMEERGFSVCRLQHDGLAPTEVLTASELITTYDAEAR